MRRRASRHCASISTSATHVLEAMRPVLTVVDLVLAQDLPQMRLVSDEGAV